MRHKDFMNLAIEQALIAKELGEVPVGCVIVKDKKVISSAHNKRETISNAIAHAEIIAIDMACKKLNSWRLTDCSIYITLEPCLMCMGAILNSRISTLIFSINEEKMGGCGGLVNLSNIKYPHKIEIIQGICEFECQDILKDFFKNVRQK